MGDLLFVALVVGFFALALLFVRGCDALTRGAPEPAAIDDDDELVAR